MIPGLGWDCGGLHIHDRLPGSLVAGGPAARFAAKAPIATSMGVGGSLGGELADLFPAPPSHAQLELLAGLRASSNAAAIGTVKPGRTETALGYLESYVTATGRVPFIAIDPRQPILCRLYNQRTMDDLQWFIRQSGSRAAGREGTSLRADTVAGYLSAIEKFASRGAHMLLTGPDVNTHMKEGARAMRRDQAPTDRDSDREGTTAVRMHHMRVAHSMGYFGGASPSPEQTMKVGVAVTAHNAVLRGGEVGCTDSTPSAPVNFDSHRDLSLRSIDWQLPCPESRGCPWIFLWVCAIKDIEYRRVPVPLPIRRRYPYSTHPDRIPLDPYDSILAVWKLRCHLLAPQYRNLPSSGGRAPKDASATAPLFVRPDGLCWRTSDVGALAVSIATAVGIQPLDQVGAKAFRIAAAIDLRAAIGDEYSERLLRERGRWFSDITFLYQRALTVAHLDASAAVGVAEGREIEAMCPGWVQPAALR